MAKMRLDKVLAHLGYGTRKEVKQLCKRGAVKVDGVEVKDSSVHVDPTVAAIEVLGEKVFFREFVYLMLNKPSGVISATEDAIEETVIDLLSPEYRAFDVFPVGRLDKDTEGLLLLTNDGKLAHQLLSPKKQVAKRYVALIRGAVTADDVAAFAEGIVLDDGYKTLPGQLAILSSGDRSEVEVTIYEGKYHQIKRMFRARGKEVLYLKRIAMGPIVLDDRLQLGEYRELTEQELAQLKNS
jgi:16S rRNA pseudouridine516 synthase